MKRYLIVFLSLAFFIAAFFPRSQQASLQMLSDSDGSSIAQGLIDGVSYIHKFGENLDVGTSLEDLWGQGGTKFYPTVGVATYISGDSINDLSQLTVQGLDHNWDMLTISIAMAGTTKTQLMLPNGDPALFVRVFRAWNSGATAYVGNVWIYGNVTPTAGVPQVADSIRALVILGEGQTQMATYTIPRGYKGHVTKIWVSLLERTASKLITPHVEIREYGGVWRDHDHWGLNSTASNNHDAFYDPPILLSAKTDIKLVSISSASANTAGGFTIKLIQDR